MNDKQTAYQTEERRTEPDQIREVVKTMRRIELRQSPFEITGLPWVYERDSYDRIPSDLMPKDSTDLFKEIATECSGGIARIRTNSGRVYFSGTLRRVKETLYHMSVVGRSGFDFHILRPGEPLTFLGTSVPFVYGSTDVICEIAVKRSGLYDGRPEPAGRPEMYELRIVLPIYNAVDEACIYVENDCEVCAPLPQTYQKQILFYGSSITQGACASRPSLCYTNSLALALDCPIINFGFSGQAMAEPELADLISQQRTDIFVMDYDHNAPNCAFLEKTHAPFYERIRRAHPQLPIVLLTKPDYGVTLDDNDARREIIFHTYQQARANGDAHISLIDGKDYFEGIRNQATVDGCHPNDLGFRRMHEALLPLLEALLQGDATRAALWQPTL